MSICDDPLPCTTSGSRTVHYRLYLDRDGRPCVICVQDFDYPDYSANRFLTTVECPDESSALTVLNALLADLAGDVHFERDAVMTQRLHAAGAPLTRRQALLVALAAGEAIPA